jgi:acyl transferase domain-containing protein/aryl carrier-like protein
MEDAGQVADRLAGSDTGVFVGGFTLDYQLLQNYGVHSRYELQSHSATGMMMTMLANRLSYSFDFRGPSLAVDTACSGSLVAVHLAAQAIWNSECRMALAGGVNVMLAPNMTIAESKGGFLSPDGRCKTFDASANGYARGEGAGVVLLKPLRQAQADGDPIYALVRGTAVSQDGRTNGITVPSGDAQEAAMRAAHRAAGLPPAQVSYVEAHGTGTPVGDPIEAAAIGRVLSEGRPADERVVVGSVKTNIGHLEAAAGIAGLIKTTLALHKGQIPGNLHLHQPNPAIAFDELQLRVPTEIGPWPTTDGDRYAGVNSFGFGGTNAHVVLQSAPEPTAGLDEPAEPDRPVLIPVSARSPEALADLARATAERLGEDQPDLRDVAYSTSLRRTHHEHRAAVVARTLAQAGQRLSDAAEGEIVPGVARGRAVASGPPKLAFVCSGMGPQWWAMGRQLLETEPVFRAAVERVDAELQPYTGWSLLEQMLAPEDRSQMAQTRVAQPANFAVQVGLAEWWRSRGVVPDAVIGHSTGEVAAQYLAGVLSFADAVKVVYYRSSLQQKAEGTGRMLAVGMTPETLDKAVRDAGPLVSVAAINSPSAVTLSGDAAILRSMADQLETFGVFHRFLNVAVPYHSHCMDPLRVDLEAGLADLAATPARIPLYSTVTGSRLDGGRVDAHYWWQNVRATVLFAAAFGQLVADGYTHVVEIGPHPVLASSMRELLAGHDEEGLVVPSLRRGGEDAEVLLESLGALHCHGHRVDWAAVNPPSHRLVRLPTYPWQLKPYWNESAEAREDRHFSPVHALLGQRMNASHPTWELEVNLGRLPYLADHRVQDSTLLPAAALVEMSLAAARETYGDGVFGVEELQLRRAIVLSPVSDPRLRTTVYTDQALVEISTYTALPTGERQWVVHATARLSRRGPARPEPVDFAAAGRACPGRCDRAEFYDQTRAMGFQYGPAFQAVDGIATGSGRAVGRISVPAAVAGDTPSYVFHPSLVDAAFQILLTAATPAAGAGEPITPYLPVGIDAVTVLAPPTAEMVVLAQVVRADQRQIVSDLTICAPDGRVLVEIDGFTAQSLGSALTLAPDRIDRSLYEVAWRPAALDAAAEPELWPTGAWVVFADRSGVGDGLLRALRAAGQTAVAVRSSDDPVPLEPGDRRMDGTDPEAYQSLVADLAETGISRVVHLWSLDIAAAETDPAEALLAHQDVGSRSVLHLVQALTRTSGHELPQLWLATRRAQPVGDGSVNVGQSPLWGMGRVIGHQELVSLWGGLVDLDDADPAVAAEQLLTEIRSGAGEDQVAVRGDTRYVARLLPARLTAPLPVRLRRGGSYVVTGGLGALGLEVAELLVERGAQDVVLMGRTALPPRSDWAGLPADHPRRALVERLSALESRGARIHLAAVDVGDAEAMAGWLAEHEDLRRPPIRGVVHTAGVVADELLQKMTVDQFDRVLRPKLVGGWLLHRLFAAADLDFFVLFSSTGSVIASPGQANYAAGNAFLDALAAHRRTLGRPAQSIGWGPWSIGMVEQLNLEQVYARRGIELITAEVGRQTLARVLDQEPAHLVAITADWATARSTALAGQLPPVFAELGVVDDGGETTGPDAGSLLDTIRQAAEGERAGLLTDYIHDVAALVLDLDREQIAVDEALSSLGLDSMMAIEMKHRIEAVVQIDIPVLELLQGATIAAQAERILARITCGPPDGQPGAAPAEAAGPETDAAELDALLATATPEELEAYLAELEADLAAEPDNDHDHLLERTAQS